jgi:polysaccharide export outer membrane protein
MQTKRAWLVWPAACLLLPVSAAYGRPQSPAEDNAVTQPAENHETYRLGAGDVIQISVWKEPAASVQSVTVRPDGKISMPLIKEVEVLGMTPAEAERAIADKLSRFIHGADVTVLVRETHSKMVYIIGAVKKEGPITLRYSMSILQALAESGGLTDYAKRGKIYVLRNEGGKQVRLPFNYDQVIKGLNMEQNIALRPDDTVVIPQ